MPTSISQFPILISVLCWIKTNLKGFKTNYCLLNSLQGISYPPKQHRFVEVELEMKFLVFIYLTNCIICTPLYFFPPDISYCRSESYNLYVSGKYWLLRLHSISAKVYFPLFFFAILSVIFFITNNDKVARKWACKYK